MLEGRLRVPALHQELAERGFVGHRNGLARRLVLGCHRVEPGAATPAVLHVRRLADARKPVGPVPAHLVAEPRAARLEAIVKRRATERPAAFMLALRPRHLVVQAERLGDAVAQPGVVAVEIGEAADVDRPQIERRLAGDDPFGQRHAGPARTRDTHRIEPGADIEAAQSRRLAQDVAEIGREALRAVHEGLDTGFLQCRDADQRIVHQDLELVPVVRQHAELEIVGDDVLVPRLGLGLEAAHQKAAHLLLEVDVAVRIAHHRQVARHALHLLGDDVHVLAGIERHGDADHAPDLARPLAGAVHHHLGLDRALGRLHAGDCRSLGALLGVDRRHPRLLEDAYAVVARALGQRLGDVGWIGLAVARQPDRAHQVVGAHDGVLLARLFGRQLLAGDALGVGHRRRAAQIGHALWRARHRDRAALLPARRQARLGLEPGIELGAVLDQARQVLVAAQLADQSRCVPGRAAAQPALFQQHDILPAVLRQMVGRRAAHDAAADDDDARLGREIRRHVTVARPRPRRTSCASPARRPSRDCRPPWDRPPPSRRTCRDGFP